MIGTVIDHYKIVARIAGGGMGEVYRAIDLELERDVAIKCVRPELSDLEEATKRFRAEARTLAKLAHLNIATVYRFFAQDDRLFLVMEYIDGQAFGAMISGQNSLPHRQAVSLVKDALTGLGYAHKHQIVHRDIKPGNLMVDAEDTVKVLDFGIAHLVGGTRLTRVGSVVGTPAYMAPEQILGKDIDQRTDLYAIGVVLYEMLSGKLPYAANSDFELMRAHLEEVPRPLSELSKNDVPAALQDTVGRALAKDTSERFQSAEEFVQALDNAERSGARTEVLPPPPPAPPQNAAAATAPYEQSTQVKIQKWLPVGLASAAGVLVIVMAWLFWPAAEDVDAKRVTIEERLIEPGNINTNGTSPTKAGAQDLQLSQAHEDATDKQVALESSPATNPTPPPATNTVSSSNKVAPTRQTSAAPVTRQTKPAVTPPVSKAPLNKVAIVKIAVHEKQGTGRFSRDAGYNGAFRLSVPAGGSRNVEVEEYAQIFRDGVLVREQSIASEIRVPGQFKAKRRIQGLKTLEPGEYEVRLLFRQDGQEIGRHVWKLLVNG